MTGLALVAMSNASVILNYPHDSGAIVALVTEFNGGFKYHYTFNKQEFTQSTQDLSHFEFAVCSNFTITNVQTNGVTIGSFDHQSNLFKFDDISDEQPTVFWVSFETPNVPHLGSITMKYGQVIVSTAMVTPSCGVAIPEPNTSIMGLVGTMLLLRRKRND